MSEFIKTEGITPPVVWPEGITRVPFWVYQQQDVYDLEQKRLFQGPHWNFLCLEADLPEAGSYRTSFIGATPVIIARDFDGEIYAYENRCSHRGARLIQNECGKSKKITCVYHAWSFDLKGNLDSIAFKDGINGKGGMPASFCMEDHDLRKIRIAVFCGLVFGSFSNDLPTIEEYLGDKIMGHIKRVLEGRKLVVLGRFTQVLPNNWKLYMENVKDSYHASILHLFFTTFEINRLDHQGGVVVDESGGHHVSYSKGRMPNKESIYSDQKLRSESEFRLKDPSMLEGFEEFEDDISLQILSIFPNFVLQQFQNSIAIRQLIPCGLTESKLNWIYLGFEGDSQEMRRIRNKQSNLVGPSGFISMEDGCIGGFVEKGIPGAADKFSVIEMGGSNAATSESRVTETSVRGFWKAYRAAVGL